MAHRSGLRKEREPMKKLDCFQACRYSNRMVIAGTAVAVVSILLWGEGILPVLFGVLAVAGVAIIVAGCVIGNRFIVCPHCSGPLYVGPRLPTHIPQYCPNCGTKIEPPGGG